MPQVIGLDIGGTFIKAGLVKDGKIVRRVEIPSEAGKGEEAFLGSINTAITRLRQKSKVAAIGVASPGAIDSKRGVVMHSPNTPQEDFPLKDVLKKHHGLPVYLDNDANCFALAEASLGAGKRYKIVVGITLGTGVGGGIIINGRIFHGRNCAGEFGHTKLDYNGWEGTQPYTRGTVEEYVSARGLMRLAKRVSVISPKHVYELAEKGEREAMDVWQEYGRLLGISLSNVVCAIDPEVIVIGGQISKAWKFFNPAMLESCKQSTFFDIPPIVKASTAHAGILGAALLCDR